MIKASHCKMIVQHLPTEAMHIRTAHIWCHAAFTDFSLLSHICTIKETFIIVPVLFRRSIFLVQRPETTCMKKSITHKLLFWYTTMQPSLITNTLLSHSLIEINMRYIGAFRVVWVNQLRSVQRRNCIKSVIFFLRTSFTSSIRVTS